MSANEILSAMSHPSDSCWDNDKQRDQLFSIFYDLTHTNMATFMGTFIYLTARNTLSQWLGCFSLWLKTVLMYGLNIHLKCILECRESMDGLCVT